MATAPTKLQGYRAAGLAIDRELKATAARLPKRPRWSTKMTEKDEWLIDNCAWMGNKTIGDLLKWLVDFNVLKLRGVKIDWFSASEVCTIEVEVIQYSRRHGGRWKTWQPASKPYFDSKEQRDAVLRACARYNERNYDTIT